jgi:hypothetical protein|tara:strand:- start:208 stop:690 length:483 start_codon:yes stop_codon:yes gene_type:complete
MDLKLKYPENALELECGVRQVYENAIKVIRESEDPQECFDVLNLAFQAFAESRPGPYTIIEWAEDLIKGYRNLGRVLRTVISSEQNTTLLEDLLLKCDKLSTEFKGETNEETLTNILDYANQVREILNEHGVEIDNLGGILERRYNTDELEKRISGLEDL